MSTFDSEAEMEDALESQLSSLVLSHGLNLLVIGRQVLFDSRRRMDLLAIDGDGRCWVVELKVRYAAASVIAQVIYYMDQLARLTRRQLVARAREWSGLDLEAEYERHFGHPLSEEANAEQGILIIAASFDPRVPVCVNALADRSLTLVVFRYRLNEHGTQLNLPGKERDSASIGDVPPPVPAGNRSGVVTPPSFSPLQPRGDLQAFWRLHEPRCVSPVLPVTALHTAYVRWARSEASGAAQAAPLPVGLFGRQLRGLLHRSGNWERVYLPPGTEIDPMKPLSELPSMSSYRATGHWLAAYRRRRQTRRDPRVGGA